METLAERIAHIQAGVPALWPEIWLVLCLALVLVCDLVFGRKRPPLAPHLAMLGMAALVILIPFAEWNDGQSARLFSGMLLRSDAADVPIWWADGVVLLCTVYLYYHPHRQYRATELYIYLLGLLLGIHLMCMAQHLLMAYLALETVSISSYLLVAHQRRSAQAAEAAMKYILYGAVSSALMLFGFSLLYGLAGSMLWQDASYVQALQQAPAAPVAVAMLFAFCGLAFKVAAVPFHFWAPDVYEAAPAPMAALLATAPKLAGFVLLGHLLAPLGGPGLLHTLLGVLALTTMTWGNVAALVQRHPQRLLAYSSIANAGYALMALVCASTAGVAGMLYFLLVYILMKLAAFVLFDILAQCLGNDITAWRGAAARLPWALTLAVVIVMVALTGLPPTAGFVAKLNLFIPVWQAYADTHNSIYLLLLIGTAVNTVISLFYYLRVPYTLILQRSEETSRLSIPLGYSVAAVVTTVLLLWLGLLHFDVLMGWVQRAV